MMSKHGQLVRVTEAAGVASGGEISGTSRLSELPSGTRGVLRRLGGGQRFISRMSSLGFTPDAEVRIIRRLGHGSIIVTVRGTQIALGLGEAAKVYVRVTDAPGNTATPPRTLRVALAGQPNAGKSTVFNSLTGLKQHVGNWPGKTVAQKDGLHQSGDTTLQIVDLPGTYSLTANSPEERIARDCILHEKPDVVVDIVDASALERSLYLLCELLALPAPVVLGLNMMDVAEAQGIRVEPPVLEAALGMPVVPMVATRNEGVQDLVRAVERVAQQGHTYAPRRPKIREDHKEVLVRLGQIIAGHVPVPYPPEWVALKLLEGDEQITQMAREWLDQADWTQAHAILKAHEDAVMAIASGRYAWIERMVRAAVTRPRAGLITVTERVDRVATHPLWGVLLLLGVLALVFGITFGVGAPFQRLMSDHLIRAGGEALRVALAGAPWWLVGLLVDGVFAGAGLLMTFLPILVIFFAVLGLLEDVGYMARAAYVMDRFMHWMGLHGKSFLPLCLGTGCNVPAVLCTRTIESPRARLLTIFLTPLVPCTARLTVLAVLTPLFFGSSAVSVALGVIGLNLLLLLVIGYALHELVLGGEHVAFVMEMPLLRLPNTRTIRLSIWRRSSEFLRKAGGIIVLVSVLLWFLSAFPDGDLETSYMASAGRFLAPFGAWMGLDWRMIVALLASVIAKENTIAALGVLSHGTGLAAFARTVTPAAGLAFLVMQVTFVPCAATVAAIHQETASWRWTAFSVALMLVISVAAGVLVYQTSQLL